jgi:hypothetical protein
MSRTTLALTAGVACIATAAVLATSGSAQNPMPTSLHLIDKESSSVGFFPHHRPRQGDRLGFGNTVTGDDSGYDRGVCTVIGKGKALCNVEERLSRGTLSAQGFVNLDRPNKNAPFAVTGGTGAYDGARGTALVTDVNDKTTDIQVTLRP